MFKQGEDKIKQKEAEIYEELDLMKQAQNANSIANIVEDAVIVDSSASPNHEGETHPNLYKVFISKWLLISIYLNSSLFGVK